MSAKLNFLCAAATLVAGAVASGCQTYDFEPVEPLAIAQTTQSKTVTARQAKPNMMILLDKSGSMKFAADPTVAGCAGCEKLQCTATCPRTRIVDLQSAMTGFLTGAGATVARVGLLPFPSNAVCNAGSVAPFPATGVELNPSMTDSDADLKAAASAVNAKIGAINPEGGTPTGASLTALGGYAPLHAADRSNFVLLLTDGAPNCNDALNRVSCTCTRDKTPQGSPPVMTCGGATANECLDKSGVVDAVKALRANGDIKTIVVGFGAEAAASSGDAADVLSAAAIAGGMERKCDKGTDAECDSAVPPAPGSCDAATKKCLVPYYKAADGAALTAALVKIGDLVGLGDPCAYKLNATPSDPKFLTVIIDGVSTTTGTETWTYSAGTVTFVGALCTKLNSSTTTAPVKVEFRIVEGL